jgi:hypothetical protein
MPGCVLTKPADNTNSKNLELYSVMGEYDNAGFPLSYCLLSTATALPIGKRTRALKAWGKCLRDKYGIIPKFAHTDKDMAEIGMLREVWEVKLQLCWWHLREAVKERLKKAKLSTTPYNVQRARSEFRFIDEDFVPPGRADPAEYEGGARDKSDFPEVPLARPNSISVRIVVPPSLRQGLDAAPSSTAPPARSVLADHVNTYVDKAPSSSMPNPMPAVVRDENQGRQLTIKLPGRGNSGKGSENLREDVSEHNEEKETQRTFCPLEHRQPIIDLIEAHLCAHPLIPGYSAPTKEGIHEWAVKQMYEYCYANDLREAWAYLWENWYRTGRWELWARSCFPEIPVLKTTMILESQSVFSVMIVYLFTHLRISWRRIKKDFLHHFHKPRLDLLVWILIVKLAPVYYRKLDQMMSDTGRYRELPSWRKEFKRIWKKLAMTPIELPINDKYRPNSHRWVCTCPSFVRSRFLVCKHLVQSVQPVPPLFFLEVKRNRTTPIWQHPTLIPLEPAVDTSLVVGAGPVDENQSGEELVERDEAGSDEGDEDDFVDIGPNTMTGGEGTFRERFAENIKTLREFCDGLEYQIQFEDRRMLEAVERDGSSLFRLARSCLNRERRMNSTRGQSPTTWEREATRAMFYRTRPPRVDNDT